MASLDGRELARALNRGARRAGIMANVAGATVVFLTIAFVGGAQNDIRTQDSLELITLFAVTVIGGTIVASVVLTRAARPMLNALEAGRPIRGEARRALLRSPWRNAVTSLAAWGVAAIVFPVYGLLRFGAGATDAVQVGVNIALGGLTTMAVVYLLNERVMRPAFAIAFGDDPPREVRGVAVGPRLLLAWVLGAAVPLVGIALVVADSENARIDFGAMQRVTLALIAIALVAGAIITRRVARSVAEPIDAVRDGMSRVTAGDLEVTVDVDDATEVGLLQAGFNHMVTGLRERERMRDLFGRHVGEEVARQALERGVELGGEIREASAVFVDLVGSTALAASRSPADVVALLNDLFRVVVRVSESEGGWVNKFEGDAALCVFGVPVADGNHAACALRAARRLREETDELRSRHPDLDIGIGASTGQVLAGNVGAERRYEYTVIGDPVNEAARLTEQAKDRDGRVLASEASVQAAADEGHSWRAVDSIVLRGRPQATTVYEPVELRSQRADPPSGESAGSKP